jgi:hypothetical protein
MFSLDVVVVAEWNGDHPPVLDVDSNFVRGAMLLQRHLHLDCTYHRPMSADGVVVQNRPW